MTRSDDGVRGGHDRLHAVLRGCSMALAVVLGVVAVWLIVTTDTRKGATIGALLGFWAVLLAAYGVFGTRRPVLLAQPGQAVDVRGAGELSRADDAAARREYEYRLAEMLRREVQAAMGAELASMRADVAALRSELVEKVGGQLRMERIETTRVIGSDIEALQHEVRQLMVSRQPNEVGSFSLGATHTALISGVQERPMFTTAPLPALHPAVSEAYAAGPNPPAPAAVEPVGPRPPAPEPSAPEPSPPGPSPEPSPPEPSPPEPSPPEPISPEPIAPEPIAPEPIAPQPISPEPIAPQSVRPEPGAPTPRPAEVDADPFASMPRLAPFTDFELDPIEVGPDRSSFDGTAASTDRATGPVIGTREPAAGSGRHANSNGAAQVDPPGRGGGGGRRRRGAGEDDDMLARILHREGVR
ncbi:MAG: hypothetical protein DLM57_08545 [Pseudonocardiales bacterium]|nr:MAG: hypothetical protein DLM57_08545 [Pseudonocardiales bacterium]